MPFKSSLEKAKKGFMVSGKLDGELFPEHNSSGSGTGGHLSANEISGLEQWAEISTTTSGKN